MPRYFAASYSGNNESSNAKLTWNYRRFSIYKVVYIPETNTIQAYLSENRNHAKIQQVTLADAEQLAQIHFFEYSVN